MNLTDIHAVGETAQQIADELRQSMESGAAQISTLLAAWRGSAADAYDASRETLHQQESNTESAHNTHRAD